MIVPVILSILLSFTASACTASAGTDTAYEVLTSALEKSLTNDIYYWQETVNESGGVRGKIFSERKVNVYGEKDSVTGETVYVPNGIPAGYAVHIIEHIEKDDTKSTNEIYAGLSLSKDKNAERNFVFYNGSSRTKKEMTASDYTASSEFIENYSLECVLQELIHLKKEDMDFSKKSAGVKTTGKVTVISFSVTSEYLNRFYNDNGAYSVMDGCERAEIEIVYGRVSCFMTYKKEYLDQKTGLSATVEPYKLTVVYLGPKFTVPSYNETDASGKEIWNTIP